jgi:subtilisin
MKKISLLKWLLSGTLSLLPIAVAVAQVGELPDAGVVPGRYIVVLKEGANRAAVVARHAVIPDFVYSAVLNGFAGVIPPARLARMQVDPDVALIEPDQVATIIGKPSKPPPEQPKQVLPTGISRIGLTQPSSIKASAVGIAIIDTGIDLDHPDLNVVGDVTFVFRTKSGDDDHGHGTHCAGIAAAINNEIGVIGVAPSAPLYAVKVLNAQGSGTYSAIIAGVDWVKLHANDAGKPPIKVANMSLGGGYSEALNNAVTAAVQAGIVFCVAAGNEGADASSKSPASCPEAITVSAIDDRDGTCGDDVFAYFSNYGELVDIAAPGVYIYSTYKNGGYATMSGTSMASPHVAGAAALYIAEFGVNLGVNPEAVCQGLRAAAYPQESSCGFTGDRDEFPEPLLHAAFP